MSQRPLSMFVLAGLVLSVIAPALADECGRSAGSSIIVIVPGSASHGSCGDSSILRADEPEPDAAPTSPARPAEPPRGAKGEPRGSRTAAPNGVSMIQRGAGSGTSAGQGDAPFAPNDETVTTTPLAPFTTGGLQRFTTGSLAPFTTGNIGRFTTGSLAPFTTGSLGPFTTGSLGSFTTGSLAPFTTGSLGPITTGSLAPFTTGPLAPFMTHARRNPPR
jgi:hypothetical protein